MSKALIHEFDPVIYPRKLWVMITNNTNQIEEVFVNPNDKDSKINPTIFKNMNAICCRVMKKDSEYLGVLIAFNNKKSMGMNTIAHESMHAVGYIFEDLGMEIPVVGNDEHAAYMIGWVAECCEIVKNYKHNKTKD